jgi:DNA-binding CsgD family transcriptional regulator
VAAVWIVDADGRLVFLNARAEELLGQETVVCMGARCHGLVLGRDEEGAPVCSRRCKIRADAVAGRPLQPLIVHRGKGPDEVVLLLLHVPIESSRPGKPCLVHVAVDITRSWRPRSYMRRVLGRERTAAERRAALACLTSREREVLDGLARDEGLGRIALELDLSHATVRNHVQHLLKKLGVHSMLEAIALYVLDREEGPRPTSEPAGASTPPSAGA